MGPEISARGKRSAAHLPPLLSLRCSASLFAFTTQNAERDLAMHRSVDNATRAFLSSRKWTTAAKEARRNECGGSTLLSQPVVDLAPLALVYVTLHY